MLRRAIVFSCETKHRGQITYDGTDTSISINLFFKRLSDSIRSRNRFLHSRLHPLNEILFPQHRLPFDFFPRSVISLPDSFDDKFPIFPSTLPHVIQYGVIGNPELLMSSVEITRKAAPLIALDLLDLFTTVFRIIEKPSRTGFRFT